MLSENIRKYRKQLNMSQDDLAEKIGVSRQSISLWETNQSQPTLDNVMALAKIFNTSSDALLSSDTAETKPPKDSKSSRSLTLPLIIFAVAAVVLIVGVAALLLSQNNNDKPNKSTSSGSIVISSSGVSEPTAGSSDSSSSESVSSTQAFDLFTYCKNFAIEVGALNGDYCIYQQEATKYGGYEDEYFSISYWADSDMVEFCLHCPLDETLSDNFYLRMRGGYNKSYEYLVSKYYRSNGESLRSAGGTIDPTTFYDGYPINCDYYQGSADGQTEFMEESRVGMCDLIRCLKQFVEVERMDCSFADFDFVNF